MLCFRHASSIGLVLISFLPLLLFPTSASLENYTISDEVYLLVRSRGDNHLSIDLFGNYSVDLPDRGDLLLHVVITQRNSTGIFGYLEQGLWDSKKEGFIPIAASPSPMFNLTCLVFYPFVTQSEWINYAFSRNNTVDQLGSHRVILNFNTIYYVEKISGKNGTIKSLYVQYSTGFLYAYVVSTPTTPELVEVSLIVGSDLIRTRPLDTYDWYPYVVLTLFLGLAFLTWKLLKWAIISLQKQRKKRFLRVLQQKKRVHAPSSSMEDRTEELPLAGPPSEPSLAGDRDVPSN